MSEPYRQGHLEVGDGHQMYFECHGNPDGYPAVYFHGGPGGGFNRGIPEMFDLDRSQVVLFDQRGCGRSTPLAEAIDADLTTNTTRHLIADTELLRERLEIHRWFVLGLSWGTTLGLAYTQTHPARVSATVLGLVTTTSRREVEWITEGVGRIFPMEWERFVAAIPQHLAGLRPVDAYARWLFDPDPDECATAALEWCTWEDAHVSLAPDAVPNLRYAEPDFRLRFARLVTHYWSNQAFLVDDQLIGGAGRLGGIPAVLLHGRYDVSGPLETALRVHRAWPGSRLEIVEDAGHGGGGFDVALRAAIAEMTTG